MKLRSELWKALFAVAVLVLCWHLPDGSGWMPDPVQEGLRLVRWYARAHVLLCLVPAFMIAGAIGVFVNRGSVLRYLGPAARPAIAYGVAAVAGSVLAVCSCTVLPLFAGIYGMGAGLGPACAFLYAGPAINVLAMVMTTRVLGLQLGLARAIGSVLFSILLGLGMQFIFRRDRDAVTRPVVLPDGESARPPWQTVTLFAAMVGILVFANWARSGDVRAVFLCCPGGLETYSVEGRIIDRGENAVKIIDRDGREHEVPIAQVKGVEAIEAGYASEVIHRVRWWLVAFLVVSLSMMVQRWVSRDERMEWLELSWGFAKQILPLLLLGVLLSGILLGRPGASGLVPGRYVELLVGASPEPFLAECRLGGGLLASLVRLVWPVMTCIAASLVGALMYFATLTEVPILEGLLGAGMGRGPALSLLLAGPALSLPNMLVIRGVMGTRRTLVFVGLVVFIAAATGILYGSIV